jgi:hypothetical protein
MSDTTIAPQEVCEHPFAQLLRTTFYDIELLMGDISILDDDEIEQRLGVLRDRMYPVLLSTPTEATPLLSEILPTLHAAYELMENDQCLNAMDLLNTLTKRFTPSPSVGGNY